MSLSTMKRSWPGSSSVVGLLCPSVQNGVVDNGFFPCDGPTAGGPDTRPTPLASSKVRIEDELDNCTDEVDTCPRVAKPGRNGPKKGLMLDRFPPSTNEDGSLPSSPGTPLDGCGKTAEFNTSHNGLDRETRDLIVNFLRIYTGLSRSRRSPSKALTTLTRVVDDVIEKHHIAYNGMIQKLYLEQRGDDTSFVTVVAKNLFSDGTTNWGRIASLVAFGAMVCKHLKEIGREHCVESVGHQISNYLLTNQQEWLLANKGWDGFVEFFHVEDPESVVRNALMAFAGVAGIGAGIAFLIR
ncbi:induced myeloid leukemia cell differentiation protein Mcl-1 homolog [Megalops cyprinoides]|uniref:induced myeloid leukemia cell differentiation protein Mcl-1 homolog n=1 Tax=Megalops cyprinoides TaxID=118141 RepID=UPI001863DC69|nr:induced myeloid leukemia cell differentiation protein Mcl-1 homolog [Megalops cyprinoides]